MFPHFMIFTAIYRIYKMTPVVSIPTSVNLVHEIKISCCHLDLILFYRVCLCLTDIRLTFFSCNFASVSHFFAHAIFPISLIVQRGVNLKK
jgi:hypothetical protein